MSPVTFAPYYLLPDFWDLAGGTSRISDWAGGLCEAVDQGVQWTEFVPIMRRGLLQGWWWRICSASVFSLYYGPCLNLKPNLYRTLAILPTILIHYLFFYTTNHSVLVFRSWNAYSYVILAIWIQFHCSANATLPNSIYPSEPFNGRLRTQHCSGAACNNRGALQKCCFSVMALVRVAKYWDSYWWEYLLIL